MEKAKEQYERVESSNKQYNLDDNNIIAWNTSSKISKAYAADRRKYEKKRCLHV